MKTKLLKRLRKEAKKQLYITKSSSGYYDIVDRKSGKFSFFLEKEAAICEIKIMRRHYCSERLRKINPSRYILPY